MFVLVAVLPLYIKILMVDAACVAGMAVPNAAKSVAKRMNAPANSRSGAFFIDKLSFNKGVDLHTKLFLL